MINNKLLDLLKFSEKDLDKLLESIYVMDSPQIDNWFSVGTDDLGLIAHFMEEREAYRYRIDLINQILNS